MRFTLDSNLLVYAVDVGAGDKHDVAGDLVARAARADCVLTVQSLAEFFHATTRKGKLAPQRSEGFIDRWRAVFPIHAADEQTLVDALKAVRQHSLSFWDAMLWAVARKANCRLLLSEDMHDGQLVGGVRFVNPFEPKNAPLIESALPRT